MAHVLVLGAGFGGIATTTRLRSLLYPVHEVVLVDRQTDSVMDLVDVPSEFNDITIDGSHERRHAAGQAQEPKRWA